MPLFNSPMNQINTPSSSSLDTRGLAQVTGQGLISAEDTEKVQYLRTTRVKRKMVTGMRGMVDSFKKQRFDDSSLAAAYCTQIMTKLFSQELQKALTEEEEELPNVIDLTMEDSESVDPDQEAIPPTPATPIPPVIEVYDSDEEEEEEMQEEENNEDAETVVLPISTTMQTCSSAESKASSTVSELERNLQYAMADDLESEAEETEYEPTEVDDNEDLPTVIDSDEEDFAPPCKCGAASWRDVQGIVRCAQNYVATEDCPDQEGINYPCICGRGARDGICLSSNKARVICDLPKVDSENICSLDNQHYST